MTQLAVINLHMTHEARMLFGLVIKEIYGLDKRMRQAKVEEESMCLWIREDNLHVRKRNPISAAWQYIKNQMSLIA